MQPRRLSSARGSLLWQTEAHGDFSAVPVIDLGPWLEGTPEGRARRGGAGRCRAAGDRLPARHQPRCQPRAAGGGTSGRAGVLRAAGRGQGALSHPGRRRTPGCPAGGRRWVRRPTPTPTPASAPRRTSRSPTTLPATSRPVTRRSTASGSPRTSGPTRCRNTGERCSAYIAKMRVLVDELLVIAAVALGLPDEQFLAQAGPPDLVVLHPLVSRASPGRRDRFRASCGSGRTPTSAPSPSSTANSVRAACRCSERTASGRMRRG